MSNNFVFLPVKGVRGSVLLLACRHQVPAEPQRQDRKQTRLAEGHPLSRVSYVIIGHRFVKSCPKLYNKF